MAGFDATPPTRLIICVDGTQRSTSGADFHTNVHRIYEGVKRGPCFNTLSGVTFNQVVQYVPGIGLADDAFSKDRIQASVLGQGSIKQIQEVYESCCALTGAKDEVWLFGFSRGAFVARAVAGLLHRYGALTSAGRPEFAKDFKKIVKDAGGPQSPLGSILSPISSHGSSANVRPPPRIQFVGAFDTIKINSDASQFDVSFNSSVHHLRHALALHEDRKALSPEIIFDDGGNPSPLREYKRSFIQAYFTGNHLDVGGAAKNAGLGLYPLQWMLLEARDCGLSLDLDGHSKGWADGPSPLSVVFPKPEKKAGKKDEPTGQWSCTTANGIKMTMHDIRNVHGLVRYNESYSVKLSTKIGSIRMKKSREPFSSDGNLRGYCSWAPQGTVIHPSVYLLLDEYTNVSLETKELRLQRHVEDWRERMLGSSGGIVNTGFWLDDEPDETPLGAIRVLVCGNTGVGKSTLINKVFGVDVTQSSNRSRGIHDVRQEITFEGRPDLIVHDSGGFEAGADDEYQAIEAFLKDKSAAVDVIDRVHVIWFCIDINSPRTLQTATEKLFQAVSQYASDVPIVVVATKKDDFIDIEFGKRRKELKKEGKRLDEEACEQYAEERLHERIETIQSEMESVPGGRLDACLAISQDDDNSIADLSKTTSQCFDTDKVRLLYIRAQVTRIDLKIDLAVCEVMRRYKQLIRSSTGSTFAPMGATINRKASTTAVTKAIINCFGLPTVSANIAVDALKANVWTTAGTNTAIAVAESIHMVGILGSAAMGGIPAWLVTGAINTAYIVPATCRLFLVMACDLTLVLARSFKEVTFRATGQPNEKDVSAAARNYRVRGYSQHVHRDIKRLVPRHNIVASYRADAVQRGVEAIFTNYKDKLMEDVDLPLNVKGLRLGSEHGGEDDASTLASTEADSTLFSDLKEANEEARAELDASTPIAELDAEKPIAELPGDNKIVELPGHSITSSDLDAMVNEKYELEARGAR